ncbi:MAG: hypothetical protein J6R38_01245 [Alistipes sp.]|nr:hypothetical protein [Alistipes sp.]
MKKIISIERLAVKPNYTTPTLEVVSVAVESGYATSGNQEPSPWENM